MFSNGYYTRINPEAHCTQRNARMFQHAGVFCHDKNIRHDTGSLYIRLFYKYSA